MKFQIVVFCLLVVGTAQPVSSQQTRKRSTPMRKRTTQVPSPAKKSRDPLLASQGALPGIVQPGRRVELIAPTDGILDKISVHEGQRVRVGQNLLNFKDGMVRAAVRAAESAAGDADLKLARVDLKLAQAELNRLLSIPDPRALPAVELDRAKAGVERAAATVEQAAQQTERAIGALEVERERLKQLYVNAPFDGVVVRISSQEGASLVRATPIITIANLSTLRVELFAELKHFGTLRTGQQYLLHASSPVNQPLVGTLVSREPLIDAATKTFRCVFEIANADRRLPAGFTVQFRGEPAPAATSIAATRKPSIPMSKPRQK